MTARPLISAVSSTDKSMRGGLGHRVDRRNFFWWTRQCVGYQIRLAFDVSNIRGELGDVGELVGLFDGLRITLLVQRRNETLVVCKERKWSPFEDVSEMTHGFERAQEFAVVRRPRALMGL